MAEHHRVWRDCFPNFTVQKSTRLNSHSLIFAMVCLAQTLKGRDDDAAKGRDLAGTERLRLNSAVVPNHGTLLTTSFPTPSTLA